MDLILTFHSIDDGGSVLSYPPAASERLVEGLLEEGARFVDIDTIRGPRTDERPRVLITFDGGWLELKHLSVSDIDPGMFLF